MAYALGPVQPHVRAAAEEIGNKFDVKTIYGFGARPSGTSDHPRGLALDFMVYKNRAQGDAIAAYCIANAKRLGVKYIIWWQAIWSPDRANEGWRPMASRGSVTANHYDHPHVSFKTTAGSGAVINVPGGSGTTTPNDNSPATPVAPVGLPNPIRGLTEVVDSLNRIVTWLTNPRNWLRIAMAFAGIILLFVALIRLNSGVAKTVTKGVQNAVA